VDLFKRKLQPLVGPGNKIESLTVYTMNKSLEQGDTAGPYRKSLLYLVSNAFEAVQPTPILGLEESVRRDAEMLRFFGLSGTQPRMAEILFAKTSPSAPPNSAVLAARHVDFDSDVTTMNCVMRRIAQVKNEDPIFSFKDETGTRSPLDMDAPVVAPPLVLQQFQAAAAPAVIMPAAVLAGRAGGGSRRALCVGIDAYAPPDRLSGCVNDANTWAATLQRLGFSATLLLDGQATRSGILENLQSLLASSRPGDVVAFAFAGHGTTVKDLDGDEREDGKDEALCPVDMSSGALIVDDDLRAVFASTPAGVNVTCFIDCCHSGTITRVFAGLSPANANGTSTGRKARFIPEKPEINMAHAQFRRQMRAAAPPLRDAAEMNEVLFSACLPKELAFEDNGAGDFTTRATRILLAGIDGITHLEFQRRVTEAFGSPARQNPNLDCAEAARARVLLQPLIGALNRVSLGGDALTARLDQFERRLENLERGN
jgi:hypothetical protein